VTELWDRLSYGMEQLSVFLPAIIGAGVLLLAGYFVARQVEKWVDRTLNKLNFNRVAKEGGLAEVMERAEPSLDPVHAVGKLAFWLVMLVVILLSSTALGLESINEMFASGVVTLELTVPQSLRAGTLLAFQAAYLDRSGTADLSNLVLEIAGP